MALQIPLQISFKDFRHSDALEFEIRERAAKLDHHAGGRLTSCRVTIKEPNKRRSQGDLYAVTIDVTMPGAELAVGHPRRHNNHAHEDIYTTLGDAFKAMERQIEEHIQRRRREVKVHALG